MRKGFTLIEMSVVLVIIGLLVGGILLSQSLIRSSRVQSIVQDVATYQSAISQFKLKYNAMPGDMANATSYWGTNPNCATDGGVGTGTQTCNGGGDGRITLSSSGPYEQFLAWQHLADGGFITGQYTGNSISGATATNVYCSPGVNCPGGRVSPSQAYLLQYSPGALGSTSFYWAQLPATYLIVGKNIPVGGGTGGYPGYALVSAAEAYSLDKKVDDGYPGLGNWRSFEATGGAGYLVSPHCTAYNTGSTSQVPDGTTASALRPAAYYTNYGTAYHTSDQLACSFEIQLNF